MKDIVLIGAGNRGIKYSEIGLQMEDGFRVVAVAEPIKERREYIRELFNIPDELCFESWEQLLEKEKFADIVLIATMDKDHYTPTMTAIEKGYNIMIEKPISTLPEECVAIEQAAIKKSVFVLVCFVLRYCDFFTGLKKLIKDGVIGKVINVQHAEDVGNVHHSHSFVRGNWGNSKNSSFMLLQKSSHDIDVLQWLLDKKCKRVSSFGSLSYFKSENAPDGSTEYCIDGCPHAEKCYYNAVKLYLESDSKWFRTTATKKEDPTDADVELALRNTQYGKCVYKCNNDVVDHQIVNMEFEDGITVNFTMSAFNKGDRRIVLMGTKGVISGNMEDGYVSLYSFEDETTKKINLTELVTASDITGGHGGGDKGIMQELKNLCNSKEKNIGISYNSVSGHMVAFASEESRLNGGKVIDVEEYTAKILNKVENS